MNDKPGGLFGFFWRFWLTPIRAEPVAVFRIIAGLVALLSLTTSLGPRMAIDLGPDGLTPPADLIAPATGPMDTGSLDKWLENHGTFCINRGFIGIPLLDVWLPRGPLAGWVAWCEAGGFWWLFALNVVALVFVIAGIMTRFSTLVALLLTVSFQARMTWVLNGGDAVIRDALFYLLLMPAGVVWSVDAWLHGRLWGKKPGPVMIEPWSVRLAQIQLCLIYLFTGLIKLGGTYAAIGTFFTTSEPIGEAWATCREALANEDWLNGVAVYWVLNDVCLNRFPYAYVPIPLFICRLLSWGTLVFEIGFPFLVMSRWTRPILLIGGALFHAGIWFHTEVGFFSAIMVAWYPLFLSGAFLARVVGVKEPKRTETDESDVPLIQSVPRSAAVPRRTSRRSEEAPRMDAESARQVRFWRGFLRWFLSILFIVIGSGGMIYELVVMRSRNVPVGLYAVVFGALGILSCALRLSWFWRWGLLDMTKDPPDPDTPE